MKSIKEFQLLQILTMGEYANKLAGNLVGSPGGRFGPKYPDHLWFSGDERVYILLRC